MSCPICGANCKCRKRGPDGMCCSCHRHKTSKKLKADFVMQLEGLEGNELQQRMRDLHNPNIRAIEAEAERKRK